MKLTQLLEAVDLLRKEGWTVQPPRRSRIISSTVSEPKRVGRPPKKGRRKLGPGRPRKSETQL
jgi:hypothetical protein